jgi:hypothetical protein
MKEVIKNIDVTHLISFVVGVLICYFLAKVDFLDIDYKVNVITSLNSLLTIMVGLYISSTLKKNQSKSANIHNYLYNNLELSMSRFRSLSQELKHKDQLKMSIITSSIKSIHNSLNQLKNYYSTFDLSLESIGKIESTINSLNELLTNEIAVNNNKVQLKLERHRILLLLNEIEMDYCNCLKAINKLS